MKRKNKDNAEKQSTRRFAEGTSEETRDGKSCSRAAALQARRWGGGSRRSSGRWRGVRVGVRCRLACRWLRNGRGRILARRGLVRLSLGRAIPGIAWRCGFHLLA